MKILASLAISLLVMSPLYAASLTKSQVLDRLIEQYGGVSNLRKLDAVVQIWSMVSPIKNQTGTDVRHIQIPDRLRVELTYPDRREVRLLNGQYGFQVFSERQPRPVKRPLRDAMRLQLMRLYSPLMLKNHQQEIQLLEEGGVLAVSWQTKGIRIDYQINTENWVVDKVAGTLSMNGASMQFVTEYSDFRMVQGVLQHHHEDKYAGGVHTASLDLSEVRFDQSFADSVFSPEALKGLRPPQSI